MLGRVADLKSAYKQLPAHPAHACFGIIGVKDPNSNEVKLFESLSLMFGQTAAVYAFLRFSRALAAIGTVLFGLVTTEFFDDFIQIEPILTNKTAHDTIEKLFKLLGWKIADDPSKRKPFADHFVALGVLLSFEESQSGRIGMACKPGRAEAISDQIFEVTNVGRMNFREALSIKGKMNFAENHAFCRVGSSLSRLLSIWPTDGASHKLSNEMLVVMRQTADNLLRLIPKIIAAPSTETPVLVFTDGAC